MAYQDMRKTLIMCKKFKEQLKVFAKLLIVAKIQHVKYPSYLSVLFIQPVVGIIKIIKRTTILYPLSFFYLFLARALIIMTTIHIL